MDEELDNPTREGEDGGQEDVVGTQAEVGGEEKSQPGERSDALSTENARRAETAQQLQKQYDEKIAGIGVINPYTGKPFASFKEFEDYGVRYKRERLENEAKKQGKPVEELAEEEENKSFLARKRQEEKEQKAALAALEQRKSFLSADLRTFVTKFPNVDVGKLEQNPKFRKFAGKRLYQEPLSELYGDFVELVGDVERAAVEKAAKKQGRGTGGGQGGGLELLTPSQRTELEEWNRDNPTMKMTGKEFLGR